jgi:hypothetical protein
VAQGNCGGCNSHSVAEKTSSFHDSGFLVMEKFGPCRWHKWRYGKYAVLAANSYLDACHFFRSVYNQILQQQLLTI